MDARTADSVKRCLNNFTIEELYPITINVHKTLTHPKGNELYACYLRQFPDKWASWKMYNAISKDLAEQRNQPNEDLRSLFSKAEMVRKNAEDDMNEINIGLMKQLGNALKARDREAVLTALEDIKAQCQNNLSGDIFKHFTDYILRCKSTSIQK